jgi:hypothetical protein
VNKAYLEICSSPEWARQVEEQLLPWVRGHDRLKSAATTA